MCGIAGFSGRYDQTLLERMNAAIVHRGPDDSGILCLPRVLSLSDDDTLLADPAPELEVLRHNHQHLADIRVTADSPGALEDVFGNCLEMALEIDRDSEYARIAQEREIAKQRAKEKADIAVERATREKEAEEAQIRSEEAIEVVRISKDQAVEVERSLREHKLTLEIEERRRMRNEVEKATEIEIERKNLEAEVESLKIAQEAEYARLEQQEEIAVRRARQKADVTKEEMDRYRDSEQSRIAAQEEVKKLEIAQQR